MLLEHKIKIYDALQNLPTVDEKKNYGDFLFVHDPGSRNCAIFVRYVNSSELHL